MDKFVEVAERKGCTAAQLALAWLLAQGPNVFVIPGTKKVKYLEENFGAAQVMVTPEEEKEIRRLVSEAGVRGDRNTVIGAFIDTVPEQ